MSDGKPLSAEDQRYVAHNAHAMGTNLLRGNLYRALATITQLTAERDAALKNQIPAGCVAACGKCGVPYEYDSGEQGAKDRCDFIDHETGRDVIDGELAVCPLRTTPAKESN